MCSVLPPLCMAILHLWLKKSSECTLACPTHPIALVNATLDDDLRVSDHMHVYPYCIIKHLIQLHVCILILLVLTAPEKAPKPLTAPMTVLCQGPGTNSELGGRVFLPGLLLWSEHCVRPVEALPQTGYVGPWYVLGARGLPHAQHGEHSSRLYIEEQLTDVQREYGRHCACLHRLEQLDYLGGQLVQIVDHLVCLIVEALHLHEVHRVEAHIVPDVEHDVQL